MIFLSLICVRPDLSLAAEEVGLYSTSLLIFVSFFLSLVFYMGLLGFVLYVGC